MEPQHHTVIVPVSYTHLQGRQLRPVLNSTDPNVSAAAPSAFHNVTLFRCEPGGQHIIDLAGDTADFLRQLKMCIRDSPCTLIEKNSTNGFLEPVFAAWLRDNPDIDTYVVAGDCTDICVLQFVLAAKAWHNARNRPLRLILPIDLVDTFDAPGHPADLMNLAALSLMRSAGAALCRNLW